MSDKIEIPVDAAEELVGNYERSELREFLWPLYDAIKAALWQPPVVKVPWIDVKEHPHPTEKPSTTSGFLALWNDGVMGKAFGQSDRSFPARITHWCPLPQPPETAPKSVWRSVDDPPEGDNALVWVCGGPHPPARCAFIHRDHRRTHWAPYVEGEPMPPLPEGVER